MGDAPVDADREPPTLDRSSPVPLWAQVLADIRRRLDTGELADRLPPEAELAVAYGVSRQTIREALRRLVAEGRLDRRRGRGTEIRPVEFQQPLGGLSSLFRLIETAGVPQTNEVLALEELCDPMVAQALGLEPDTPLVHLDRLRLAGDRPLALDRAWLPAELARPLLAVDFRRTALYDELADRCGVRPDRGVEEIRPLLADQPVRQLLRLPARAAILAVERRTWSGSEPVELRRLLLRGDRIGLVAHWPQPDGTASPPNLSLAPLGPLADDPPRSAPSGR
jgi:GntR family transcriptional regulator